MTEPRKPASKRRKPSKPVAGRALIVACALTGTLGGWGAIALSEISAQQPNPTNVAVAQPATTSIPTAASGIQVQLAPLPTVIPPVDSASTVISLDPIPAPLQLNPIPNVSQQVPARPLARSRSSR
ncbi:MAG: hypothetical protein J5I90_09855 [Caldilineales bacterium]|nr:hypothetical protein [Caldilineales bacterium]